MNITLDFTAGLIETTNECWSSLQSADSATMRDAVVALEELSSMMRQELMRRAVLEERDRLAAQRETLQLKRRKKYVREHIKSAHGRAMAALDSIGGDGTYLMIMKNFCTQHKTLRTHCGCVMSDPTN